MTRASRIAASAAGAAAPAPAPACDDDPVRPVLTALANHLQAVARGPNDDGDRSPAPIPHSPRTETFP